MKKTISYFSAIVLTLAGGQETLAQEAEEGFGESFANFFNPNWKKDFSVTIGTKVWLNEWTADSFLTPQTNGTAGGISFDITAHDTRPGTLISDIEPTPIPQIGIRYKRLVVAASYYPETDFDFPVFESTITADLSSNFNPSRTVIDKSTFNDTAEREEWDAALGVYVLYPYVVILGGYKEIDQKFSETVTGNFTIFDGVGNVVFQPPQSSSFFSRKIKISGPTIGISGSAPMAHGLGIYANYAHGFMDADITDSGVPTVTADAQYDVAELGFTYNTKEWLPHMPLSAAIVYAGYRYQNIETEFEAPTGNRTDTTRGFAAGVNLTW